jgi:uncharacterized NAD-dependent epimerase/dehydratase family protein
MAAIELRAPYLIFLGDEPETLTAKTGVGIAHWRPDLCVGQLRLPGCGVDLGLPDMTPAEAAAAGAKSLIWGVASVGGVVPASWVSSLLDAVEAGLDIVAGTHAPLAQVPGLADAAERASVSLVDIRTPPPNIDTGNGIKRRGKRLLTIGTDCCVGKKYTALALAREMADRGMNVDFRATGQTGIMIAGGGIPIDAVVSDFVSGAAEILSPDNDEDHWDIIEGQGSLFHPAYAAVTLGLLHGSQPDVFVVCHEAGREVIDGFPQFPLPEFDALIKQATNCGKLTNPGIHCIGISVNTSNLSEKEREDYLRATADATGLPCVDPVATGVGPLVDNVLCSFR